MFLQNQKDQIISNMVLSFEKKNKKTIFVYLSFEFSKIIKNLNWFHRWKFLSLRKSFKNGGIFQLS